MTRELSLNELWNSTPPDGRAFSAGEVADLPAAARRYLEHAVAPGTRLASAVRLWMHGEIKLRGWLPFTAEQVIRRDRGMIWQAAVRMRGLPVRGSDRLLDGEGAMRWNLLGMIPVMTASGPDVTRSAAGRLAAESIWLPSVLLEDVSWTTSDSSHAQAGFAVQGHPVGLALAVGDGGRLESLTMQRWGDPGGAGFHLAAFGGVMEDEATFEGYTIPTRLRIGWYFGTERFEPEGEFFRVTVDEAAYR
jgi:hypothetical protein